MKTNPILKGPLPYVGTATKVTPNHEEINAELLDALKDALAIIESLGGLELTVGIFKRIIAKAERN